MRSLILGLIVSMGLLACKGESPKVKISEVATQDTIEKIKNIEAKVDIPDGATAAETLLYATGADASFKSMMVLSVDQMVNSYAQSGENISQAELDKLVKIGNEEVDIMMPEIISDLGKVYENHFTDEEMLNMAAFFQSGAGLKFIEKQQAITGEAITVGEGIGQKLVQRIQERLGEK